MIKQSKKIELSLIRPEQIVAIASVLENGAAKYGRDGYLEESVDSIISAMLRHIHLWKSGERRDIESGLLHSWHIAANGAILVSLTTTTTEAAELLYKDRSKSSSYEEEHEEEHEEETEE